VSIFPGRSIRFMVGKVPNGSKREIAPKAACVDRQWCLPSYT
jgi:hypothetical protein